MSTITAIEPQKRRENRSSIFVDGEFVAGVHEDVVVALGLSVGQMFDRGRLEELLRAETVRKARDSALRLITYRDRTKSEIRKRLIGNDFPEDVVEEIVDQLVRVGLLDDGKFSRDWVKSRTASRPMGRTRLAWELRTKGVEAPLVEEVLEELDSDTEIELAVSLAEGKLEKMDREDPSAKNRLYSFLQRRGFNWEIISRVFEKLFADQD